MQRYGNLSGNSGVTGYETGGDWIIVRFRDGDAYLYSYAVPGARDVEAMKKLAVGGAGLATYINEHVRKSYERKITS